jgi:hypothetical protein
MSTVVRGSDNCARADLVQGDRMELRWITGDEVAPAGVPVEDSKHPRAQSAAFLPDFQRYHLEPATGAAYPARKPRNHCCT